MIETIIAFLLSQNFALLMTAITAILAVISGYLGNKNSKTKKTVDMLIKGIEIANSPDTKKVIKDLAEGHAVLKTIDFQKEVSKVTDKMKEDGISSIQQALDDIEAKSGVMNNLKLLADKFRK